MRYYLLEGWMLVRVSEGGSAEIKKVSGDWEPYDDLWAVETNGREISEAEALRRK